MKFTVTSSPHIRGKRNTQNIMLDVIIALLPALIAGTIIFGMRALLVALVCIVAAVVSEWVCGMVIYHRNTVNDLSSVVTGLLLALTLPATVPYWVAAVGSIFAIVVVKGLCGGLGKNVFNPALGARAFLVLLWPVYMVRYIQPGTVDVAASATAVDAVASATPLHHMQMPALPETSIMDMFLGNIGGTIGEVCTLALLVGGIYLIVKGVISARIPGAYLGTVAVLSLVFSKGDNAFAWMLYSLLGGGVVLGALFMATDYATSPVTPKGQIVYGIGCGVLTVIFRYFGLFPEGVTYAILLMNACVWAIDRYTAPRRFGTKKGETV
ncbi:MAG: RnfABCDGE type electron transport complex subunit D [Lachnospiraceae bacterium]|nr:RnfABCDGE type electron transport complex subunit D [Lachnospiraceae bacterium]